MNPLRGRRCRLLASATSLDACRSCPSHEYSHLTHTPTRPESNLPLSYLRRPSLRAVHRAMTRSEPSAVLPLGRELSEGFVEPKRRFVVWFRNDLRVHDNPILNQAPHLSLALC